MNKINGYTEEEAKSLVEFVAGGRREGKTLSGLFASYAQKTGRATGSVRNYYYALLRCTGDKRVKEMLAGKNLKAEKILPFSEEETDKILREILYRNVVGKQPERIERLMRECGLAGGDDAARRRIEEEINELYDKLASSLKEENKRLTTLIKRLTDENALLRLQLRNS